MNNTFIHAIRAAAIIALALLNLFTARANNLWWDPVPGTAGPGDGSGTWSTAAAATNWWDGAQNITWTNANQDTAVIGFNTNNATAFTVTVVGQITAGGITFTNSGTNAYHLGANTTGYRASVPTAFATNLTIAGGSPLVLEMAHFGNQNQNVDTFNVSVSAPNGLSVRASTANTNSFVRFANITNNILGDLYVGTPGTAEYGGTTALFCDFNTPTDNEVYVSILKNTTNVTVYSNATFRVSNHNTGSAGTVQWPKRIIVSGDGRNGMAGAWVVTGNVGDNFVSDVVLAGGSTIEMNAGTSNRVYTLYGTISGTGPLKLVCGSAGGHTLQLTNICAYSGDTTVAGLATLRLQGGNDRLPVTTALTLGASTLAAANWNRTGTLLLGNSTLPVNQTIAGLQSGGIAGNLVAGGHSTTNSFLTVNNASDNVYAGTMGGASAPANRLGLIKSGAGKLSLQGANQCNGGFTVTAGTLEIGDGATDYPLSGHITNNAALTINVASALTHVDSITGSGGLTKGGSGALVLNGTNSYAGTTLVQSGKVTLNTAKTGTGAIHVGNFAELEIKRHATSAAITAASASADSSTLDFNFNLKGINATAPLNVTGAFTNNGTTTVNISGQGTPTVGSYPLIKYGSYVSNAFSDFSLTSFSPKIQAHIANNPGNGSIDLVVDSVSTLTWTGAQGGDWDLATQNWVLNPGSFVTNFTSQDLVRFDDSATGSTLVTNMTTVDPAGMVVTNSAKNYTFTSWGIIGNGSIVKQGSGKLTLAMGSASYAGGTFIQAGTLEVGDGVTDLSLPGDVQNDGTLLFNVVSAVSPGGIISGTGAVTKTGTGALTLSTANTYSGATTISNGMLNVGDSGALGSAVGGTTVNSGAELHLIAPVTLGDALSLTGSGSGTGALVVDNGVSTWIGNVSASADTLMATTLGTSSLNLQGTINAGASQLTFQPVLSSAFTLAGNVTAGAIVLDGAGALFLNGANDSVTNVTIAKAWPTAAVPALNAGLWAQHDRALGTNGTVTLLNTNVVGNNGSILRLGGNANIPAGVALAVEIKGDGISQYRATLGAGGAAFTTNTWNSPITLHGDTNNPISGVSSLFMLRPDDNATLVLNGKITLADGVASVLVRGQGIGTVINGQVNFGTNALAKQAEGGASKPYLTVNSTGNIWSETQLNDGLLNLGIHDALPTDAPVRMTSLNTAVLNMNGYNQRVHGLYGTVGSVRNNSTNTDSTLKVSSAVSSNWIYSGTLVNVAGAKALNLDVAGDTLTLTAAGNNYVGGTTIRTNATIALTGSGNISASTPIDVQAGGTFDVSGRTGGACTLTTGRTLMGNGTVNGSVSNAPGSTLSPGASIGTLTITTNLDIAGNLLFEVNKALSPSNDVINVAGTITNTGAGTLTVSNLGPALVAGNKFTLFNQVVVGGGTLNIAPAPGAGLAWTNKLAVNGSIEVVPGPATNPTNLTFSVSGGSVYLSWPGSHRGWRLETQTNSLSVGLRTTSNAWLTVPGTTAVTATNFPINPASPTVFFRLAYP